MLLGRLVMTGALEDAPGSSATQADNQLANATFFNIQKFCIGALTEADKIPHHSWLWFGRNIALAESSWLLRASLLVNT